MVLTIPSGRHDGDDDSQTDHYGQGSAGGDQVSGDKK